MRLNFRPNTTSPRRRLWYWQKGREKSAPPRHPDYEHPSQVLFDTLSSRSAPSGPGNDSYRLVHLLPIIYANIAREKFGKGMDVSWRLVIDNHDTCPSEVHKFFLQSSLTVLGKITDRSESARRGSGSRRHGQYENSNRDSGRSTIR